jgi:triacylglycerol lipase
MPNTSLATSTPSRRRLLQAGLLVSALAVGGCAGLGSASDARPPIVFVHGNGDSAALWTTTLWRFESQGWPRDRLDAIDLPYPLARDDDTVAQAGRSSAAEQAQALSARVDRVLARTGASQVVLVGNSRGGNAIRNYVQNFGGAAKVSHAILGGTPNHGVQADPAARPNNEFNGAGPFLRGLNAPKGPNGDEVTPGVRWMTLRSDKFDKFAQPDGRWIGRPGQPTYVTAEGPALKGARNVVLPGRDHREVSYHPEAFAQTWQFITGQPPRSTAVEPEPRVVLDGMVDAGPTGVTNLGTPGATVEVHAVDPATGARIGTPLHRQVTGADGRWGPMETVPTQALEFVVSAPGHPTVHVYRSAFPRSSSVVHFRPERVTDADKAAQALVVFTRPRGYFGLPRDRIELDGTQPAPGIPAGVPGLAASRLRLDAATSRPVVGSFESGPIRERVVGRTWPLQDRHVTVLELHN